MDGKEEEKGGGGGWSVGLSNGSKDGEREQSLETDRRSLESGRGSVEKDRRSVEMDRRSVEKDRRSEEKDWRDERKILEKKLKRPRENIPERADMHSIKRLDFKLN